MDLCGLPPELLVMVFKCLDTIDELCHLARVCKHINGVWEGSRLTILKNLITYSPYHEYDLRLSYLNSICSAYGSKHDHYGGSDPDLVRRNGTHAECRPKPEAFQILLNDNFKIDLDAEAIWTVVVRWSAMRLWQKIYSYGKVRIEYASHDVTDKEGAFGMAYSPGGYPGDIGLPDNFAIAKCISWKPQSNGRAYRALTATWLKQQACYLHSISRWPDRATATQEASRLEIWPRSKNYGLLDMVDAFEASTFLTGWCLRRLFQNASCLKKILGNNDLWSGLRVEEEYWKQSLCQFSYTLTPPDILLLILNALQSFGPKFDQVAYLRKCGSFDDVHIRGPAFDDGYEEPMSVLRAGDYYVYDVDNYHYDIQCILEDRPELLDEVISISEHPRSDKTLSKYVPSLRSWMADRKNDFRTTKFAQFWFRNVDLYLNIIWPSDYRSMKVALILDNDDVLWEILNVRLALECQGTDLIRFNGSFSYHGHRGTWA